MARVRAGWAVMGALFAGACFDTQPIDLGTSDEDIAEADETTAPEDGAPEDGALAQDATRPACTTASSTPVDLRPVAVIDAIKLLESGWKPICDAIWVVTCAPEQQLVRLMRTRGMSEDEARTRIAAQPPQSEKVAQATVVIDNSGSIDATRRQVAAAWQSIFS